MTAIPPVLETRALGMGYGHGDEALQVIRKIDLQVAAGEFLCIIGPSGCGKTTLLQLLGGLMNIFSGEILLSGRPMSGPHPDISMVFQKPNLMPWRTVLYNVMLPLRITGVPIAEAKERARRMLHRMGLEAFSNAYPKALSGGMAQRTAVARALVVRPRILLLDEPFSALDALTRDRLNLELLRLWRDQNITAVMVTHQIREAVLLADRVIVLSPRPATVAAEIVIDLPRPRTEEMAYTPYFAQLALRIRRAIQD